MPVIPGMPAVPGMVTDVPDGIDIPDLSSINFADKSSLVSTIHAVNISLIVLVVLTVGTRLIVRLMIIRKLFVDDILAVIAAVFTCAMASVCLAAVKFGMGKHVWNLPLLSVMTLVKKIVQILYADHVLYACAISFTKFSIAATFLHFIPYGRTRYFIWAMAIITAMLGICSVFVTIFQCTPVYAAWDFMYRKNGSCIKIKNYLYASTAINIVTDIALCAIPVPHIWQLRLAKKQKVILCMLLCLGSLACVASIIRLTKMEQVGQFDVTYLTVDGLNWSVVECALGIICVSIPPIRPLAIRVLPKYFSSNGSSNNYTPNIDTIPLDSRTNVHIVSELGAIKSDVKRTAPR